MHKQMTKPQTRMFWRLFARSCQAQGIPSDERDAYRKTIMWEECHVEHLADLDCCGDFDRIMIRLALDAEDYELAARFDSGDERRLAHLVEVCARQLMQLHGSSESDALAYVLGVIRQARFPCRLDGGVWWLDLVEGQLSALFAMLDTHRRRCLKAAGWDESLKFSSAVQYVRHADGSVKLIRIPITDAELLIRVA